MKTLLITILIFISYSLTGQSFMQYYGDLPKEEIIDFEYYKDTLVLTIIYYEYEYEYNGYYFDWMYVKKVRKIVYEAKELFVLPGEVIPKQIIEETYEFEKDFKFKYIDSLKISLIDSFYIDSIINLFQYKDDTLMFEIDTSGFEL